MATRPRIKDVAERAGVSTATVSLVLNDVTGIRVSLPTRERVRSAATELGYRPNELARSLRTHRTHMIGFVSDEIATTPYAGKMIQGAQDAAWREGYVLMLVNTGGTEELQRRGLQALLERQVDGVVFATMWHRIVDLPDAIASTPVVALDARPRANGVPYVVPDEVGGAAAVMTELVRAGHRRIGHITDHLGSPAAALRLQAYREVLARHDIPLDSSLVVADDTDHAGGHLAAGLLLERPEPPTAIFCFNDQIAMGAYRAAAERGLRIPADLSVVGFDDQELIAAALSPGLTTVALPHYAMGEWALRVLLERIAGPLSDTGPGAPPAGRLMPCPLVRRASVGPPPRRPPA
jgi:LacI family transcriptional regulator